MQAFVLGERICSYGEVKWKPVLEEHVLLSLELSSDTIED